MLMDLRDKEGNVIDTSKGIDETVQKCKEEGIIPIFQAVQPSAIIKPEVPDFRLAE